MPRKNCDRTNPARILRKLIPFLIIVSLTTVPGRPGSEPERFPEYTIVIDPGHGGTNGPIKDDKWDTVTGHYLQPFAQGAVYRGIHEHVLMLALARSLKAHLDLTQSKSGWKRFVRLMKRFSPQNDFNRVIINSRLIRNDGWTERPRNIDRSRINDPYRLYDYPAPDHSGLLAPGRVSLINAHRPCLVVSLHMNGAPGGHKGGMAAVLAPGFRTFDLIRLISLGKKPRELFDQLPWSEGWLITDNGWSKYDAARSDTWVYFNGYRVRPGESAPWLEKFRGYRYNMVHWRYADPPGWESEARLHKAGPYALKLEDFEPEGSFWDRERSQAEEWRREDGPEGYGGDNHYASAELLRFVQYGVRLIIPSRRHRGAMGDILTPFISTYTVPTYMNAISAYLEIGHLNRYRDRILVTRYRETTAASLAVGIYSLFQGMTLRPTGSPYRPRGKGINFERYEKLPDGNYFHRVIAGSD